MPVPVVSVFFTAVRLPSTLPTGVPVALTRCTSFRSTSVNVRLPLSVRLPAGVPCSVTAPVTSVADTIGASLVPVMVTSTRWATVPPWPSLIVTVNFSVAVWPTARYCVALLATV